MSDKFGSITGIDVSNHQDVIDWQKVKEDQQNIQFAFIKASQGDAYTDKFFSDNVKGHRQPEFWWELIIYADLIKGGAEKEARNFVEKLKQHKLDLMPVLDLEEETSLTPDEIADWALEFSNFVTKETGEKVLLYTFPAYISKHGGFNNRLKDMHLWLAHWEVDEPQLPEQGGFNEITCWQFTDKGTVSGIRGNVDMNKAKSLDALKGKKGTDNPPQEPPPNQPQPPEDNKS